MPKFNFIFYVWPSFLSQTFTPSFGKNLNQTLQSKVNQVRIFFSQSLSWQLQLSFQNKEGLETVILSIREWEWASAIISSVYTDIHYGVLAPPTHWLAPFHLAVHTAVHTLCGPRPVAFPMPDTPVRGIPRFGGLLQLFFPPSLQVHGTCLRVLACQVQIIRNLRAVSGPLCLDTVWQHFYSVLTTQWGMVDILCLVGFPQSHPAWRTVLPCLWITYCPSPLLLARKKFPSQRYPMLHPTLFIPFCFANILNLQVK